MNEKVNFGILLSSSRARVYLLWTAVVAIGFTWTHYYQNPNINIIWTVLSIIGFAYMYKVMPLKIEQMKKIYASWLIPIIIGMGWSVLAVRTDLLPQLVSYLGPFWLIVMGVAFVWNGLVDKPERWYYVAAAVCVLAAVILCLIDVLLNVQYLVTAVVSTWAMLMLWVFRGDT